MTTKEKMIEGAITLLATKGLQATSFSEVLALTGAPRGSIYYHFPDGKDQLVAAALETVNRRTMEKLQNRTYNSPSEVVEYFIDLWRQLLIHSRATAGCSVLAVAVATDSPTLRDQANAIFEEWTVVLTKIFIVTGVHGDAAEKLSRELISTTEGAVVMARAAHDLAPFEKAVSNIIERSKQF